MNDVFSNLKRLGQFKGRERRARFWPFAGSVFVAIMLISSVALTGMVFVPGTFLTADTSVSPRELVSSVTPLFWMNDVILIVSVLSLAAAVSRRLHDSGIRGYWGLLPLPFMAVAAVVLPSAFGSVLDGEGDMRWFSVLFLNNSLYMAAIVTLIILLCRPTTKGANRYGDEPA